MIATRQATSPIVTTTILFSILSRISSSRISPPTAFLSFSSPRLSQPFRNRFRPFSNLHAQNRADTATAIGCTPLERNLGAIVSISDAFDGGNIEHVETTSDQNVVTVKLKIKPDPYTELEQTNHFQYFSFRTTIAHSFPSPTTKPNSPKLKIKYVILNASEASYPQAWDDYTTFASRLGNDGNHQWYRVLNTHYDKISGQLIWTHDHTIGERVHFAYFPPYSYERHLRLISKCFSSRRCNVTTLGQSLDGRELECIVAGTGERVAWIIHRQHPGETMAGYFAEGVLGRLFGLDTDGSIDGLATEALKLYRFYIVPNMCPDGAVRGHLRTNAIGSNLNREWASSRTIEDEPYDAPTVTRSPEVYHVWNAMRKTGVDVFLDVHGDEELPYNFLAGGEGCPNWSPRVKSLQGAFAASYGRANSDMQSRYGYEPEAPNTARMNVCSNQVGSHFDCLSFTLEMPFKDCRSHEDPRRGWCPERATMLGRSCLDALAYVQPYLRTEGEFWKDWTEEDGYVCPTSDFRGG